MMSRKIIFILLAVVAAILLVFAVSLNAIIEQNRGRIQEEVQKALGRPLAFGELRLSLWGGIGISAKELRIGEDPHFAASPFIQTKEVKMQLSWLPLFVGRLQIKKFVLDEPEIQIIKNEEGNLNVSTLAAGEKKPKAPREPGEKRAPRAPRLFITAVEIKDGKIDYIDRSSKEVIEVRVRNVDLDIGEGRGATANVKFAANLFESQGQNATVTGRIGPLRGERSWSQVPVELQIRFESLLLPQLTYGVPALRETISRYVEVSGPVELRANITGALERPHITNFKLTGPFFGAAANNATVEGDLDLTKGNSWDEGEIKGKLAVDPLPLNQLKRVPFFRQALPASLTADGPLSLTGEVEGSLADFKMRAKVKASESNLAYGKWLAKPKGVAAELDIQVQRQKNRLVFEPSTMTMHTMKLGFSGSLDELPTRQLTLNLVADGLNLAGWDKLLPPLAGYDTSGNAGWKLTLKKNLAAQDGGLEIRGALKIEEGQAKDKKSGHGVDRVAAQIAFRGKDARVERLTLRGGASEISLDGTLTDFAEPHLRYNLRAPRLVPTDLPGVSAPKGDEMKGLAGAGELRVRDGKIFVQTNLSSTEGAFQEIPYRNLRGEFAWSPTNAGFKNLSFQAMNGSGSGNGSWETGADGSLRVALDPNIESMDLKTLLSQKFPAFKDHIEGRLNLKAKLKGDSKNLSTLPESLQGDGEMQIRNGSLKDFNLVELVLSKMSRLPGASNMKIPARQQALAQRKDTPFDNLSGTFTVKQGRIATNDLVLSTPEYSINAAGSIGLDKSMKWKATLVMSPQFTRELVQEHKNLRYLVDRQGRLSIPFRLEGKLPKVQAMPDLQGLAESFKKDFLGKGAEPAEGQAPGKDKKKRDRRERIQKQIEQFLGK